MKRKVGVVLSGCGYLDGAEIREAVLALLALDRHGCEVTCAAPAVAQAHVVDHQTGQAMPDEARDVLAESARIARGNVRELSELRADDLDALVLPGGFGVAKNLSDFAQKGAAATAHPEVERLLREMHANKKPIGAICIAPALVAVVLGRECAPTLTIGDDADTARAIEELGARHQESPVDAAVVDRDNRIVTTPAYMYDARIRDVAAGIDALVDGVMGLLDA